MKRALDLLIAVPVLILLSPLMLVVAVLVQVSMGRPAFFRQQRPGLYGEPFVMLKFRTMRNAVGSDGRPLADAERLTGVGRFLRRSSLDELPELINVVRGSMSLVGPRPLLMEYLEHYTPEQMRRHEARPGITGWAQVNGRNAINWGEKFAYDVWYVEHWSLRLDLTILLRTVRQVFVGSGISHGGHETMPKFARERTENACPNSSSLDQVATPRS